MGTPEPINFRYSGSTTDFEKKTKKMGTPKPFNFSYSGSTTDFEKKTNGIANGPTSNAANTQNILLAWRDFAT